MAHATERYDTTASGCCQQVILVRMANLRKSIHERQAHEILQRLKSIHVSKTVHRDFLASLDMEESALYKRLDVLERPFPIAPRKRPCRLCGTFTLERFQDYPQCAAHNGSNALRDALQRNTLEALKGDE